MGTSYRIVVWDLQTTRCGGTDLYLAMYNSGLGSSCGASGHCHASEWCTLGSFLQAGQQQWGSIVSTLLRGWLRPLMLFSWVSAHPHACIKGCGPE